MDDKVAFNIVNRKKIQACSRCKGEGQMPSRKRRKRRRSKGQNNLNPSQSGDQQKTTAITTPPIHMDPCKVCSGSGIVQIEIEEDSGVNSDVQSQKVPWIPEVKNGTHVAIIGGGIGGLALAIACQHRNIPCTVYERDLNIDERKQGYGLTMQQGAKALLSLGIQSSGTRKNEEEKGDGDNKKESEVISRGERLFGKGIHSKLHLVHLPNGEVIGEWGMKKWGRPKSKKEDSKRQNAHVARQELRRLLYEQLENKEEVIRWGHKLVGYTEIETSDDTNEPNEPNENLNGGGVSIQFQVRDCQNDDALPNVVTRNSSTLVGADGIRSAVRKNKIGDKVSPLRYLGCIVVLGIAPSPKASPLTNDGETVFQTADGTTRLYAMPFSKKGAETASAAKFLGDPTVEGCGETMWQLSFPMDENDAKLLSSKGPLALKEEALRRCGAWHQPIPELLQCTPEELISGYPVYDRELLSESVFRTGNVANPDCSSDGLDSRVTLLGDAAHPMSPFKGQGANQALLDAVLLARALFKVFRVENDHGEKYISLGKALSDYEESMLQRSASKVKASAEAAKFLHSEVAIMKGDVTRGAAAKDLPSQS